MKRSQINEYILWTKELLKKLNFTLPDFAYWSMEDWIQHKDEIGRIKSVMPVSYTHLDVYKRQASGRP